MRWNDNRLLIFGLSTSILFLFLVAKTAETGIEMVVGSVLYLLYLVVVLVVTEIARAELLPEGMSMKEAGYGDKKYRFLSEAEGDAE